MVSPTICPYPFVHQQIQPDGEIRFCCAARPNSNQDARGNIYFVTKDKLIDAWNSDSIKKLRLELINGEKPECCSYCWIRENESNTDGASMRLEYIRNVVPVGKILDRISYAKENNGELNQKPYDFQVMTGNLCNLSCKMCTPQYSTNFSKYFLGKGIVKLGDITFNKNSNRFEIYEQHYNKTYDWPVKRPLKETFSDYFDSIQEIFFLGGEPTLLDGTVEFLEYLKEHNLSNKILVRFSTNGTNINQRLLQSLEKFEQIHINVSLDGMDEIAYIQRTPSDWKQLKLNLDKLMHWANLKSGRITSVHSVMTSLNFHHLLDFWIYLSDEYQNLSVSVMEIAENDDNFPISLVPNKIAKLVKEKFENLKNNLKYKNLNHALLQVENILNRTQFSDSFELIHYQLEQIQKFHPDMDIKKIYSIYYNDVI